MKIFIRFILFCIAIAPCSFVLHMAQANPEGLTVQSGSASTIANGAQLNITASHNAFLNWQSFNINSGETTTFIQPSATSVVWNKINDQNPSQIYGALNANGTVVLMNQSGFYFGPNSFVSAAGLVVSIAPVTPLEPGGGLFWQFSGAAPEASIVNYGALNIGRGGAAFLIAEKIENHGSIIAPEGSIGLHAGKDVLISERPDGRGLSAQVNLPAGSIDNTGRLIADAGNIALQARVVNQNGLVQANSVRERNGIIELVAADSIALGNNSIIQANGDGAVASDAGQIKIKSERNFADLAGSRIQVAGGGLGGDGGFVEISAPEMSFIKSHIDAHAQNGSIGGHLFIDPRDIVIGNSGTGSAGSGTVNSGDAPAAGTLNLDVNSAFTGFYQIHLQATRNITISSGVTWDLFNSTGNDVAGSLLKLEAGNNVTISSGASILAGENWSVTLQAGRNFASPDAIISGTGIIAFSGTASLETGKGDINLLAGNNITVASGFVKTIGGGNISARAVAGNVNTGTRANGFKFLDGSYYVDPALGGISTAGGGNVTITAGNDIISYLPFGTGFPTDAGSGAFGAAPGNVTLTAGRDISGHYVVRNGTGTINAGRNAGISTRLLALSLASGGWSVNAGQDILLQEVRSPNGTYNYVGTFASLSKHVFDYSPDAYTLLNAGNSVQLLGTSLPRYADTLDIPIIYPGRLEISSGAGGVLIGNETDTGRNIILYPSPTGNLKITTASGGSFTVAKPDGSIKFIVSDSGKSQYRDRIDFDVSDHAAIPVHLNDLIPVKLDISGDMVGIALSVPKRAEITIGGDMINSRFEGQNLHATDVTSLYVGGDILNRNVFTSVVVSSQPDFTVFDLVYPPLTGAYSDLQSRFSYNETTHTLTIQGKLDGDVLDKLLALQVRTFDENGFPILDANKEPVTKHAEFIDEAALRQLYTASEDVPSDVDTGYLLGGGGLFDIRAHNLELGATAGIASQGPRANNALANYFTSGADIHLSLTGDLNMFSTKIASLNGGDISIIANGNMSIGSRDFSVTDAAARGIFTVDQSDITLIARGDINLNGSRVAAYDGGNVTLRSLEGNVDAGNGGNGAATVEKLYVDPITHEILTYTVTIPGSGILATTFPPSIGSKFPESLNQVGNILIETPRGNITASAGGIVQNPLNGINPNGGQVTLLAGTKDANGDVVYVGNIDVRGSGVIGGNVKLNATGNVIGRIIARGDSDLSAVKNVDVIVVTQGTATVNAGGDLTGTIIGLGGINASGTTGDVKLLSQNVTSSGDITSSPVGFAQGTAANSTSQSLQSDELANAVAKAKDDDENDPNKNGKGLPQLKKTIGRVTVLLPNPK